MTVDTSYGLRAFQFGAVSIVAVSVAIRAEKALPERRGVVLATLDKLGLVKVPSTSAIEEVRSVGLPTLTDQRAVAALLCFGVFLSVCAILFSFRAEANRENSLFLGAGFMCATAALVEYNYLLGISVMLFGGAVLLALRRRNDA